MAHTLVTGGAGFLGSHLCDRLIEQGHLVDCIDNLFTGNKSNISHFSGKMNFKFLNYDVTFPLNTQYDEIYNLACPASPIHYQSDPVQTIKTNVLGAINMLELATRCGAKILQASTSEVYGTAETDLMNEGHPLNPMSPYAAAKAGADRLVFSYNKTYGIPSVIIRPFNNYGPYQFPEKLIPLCTLNALNGKSLPIYGDGQQIRDWIYVKDHCSAIHKILNEGQIGETYNVGSCDEKTNLEVVQTLTARRVTDGDL